MTKDDGGYAFPKPGVQGIRSYEDNESPEYGMSLRDYFAAAALTGMYSDGCPADTVNAVASDAYRMADAMLAERNK